MEARDQPFGLLTFLCFYVLLYHDGKGSLWITRALPYDSKHPTIVEVRKAEGSHVKSASLLPGNYLLCALPRANRYEPRKCQRAPALGAAYLVTSRLMCLLSANKMEGCSVLGFTKDPMATVFLGRSWSSCPQMTTAAFSPSLLG
jgi:hypothetical protein